MPKKTNFFFERDLRHIVSQFHPTPKLFKSKKTETEHALKVKSLRQTENAPALKLKRTDKNETDKIAYLRI